MKVIEGLKIEISGSDAEKIIGEYVEKQMNELGYTISSSKNEDGPYPDSTWFGSKHA